MGEPTDELASYQSIKRVQAGEITEVMDDGCYVRCTTGIAVFRPFEDGMTARFVPSAGDYWVVYEDGYQALSPRGPFEAGYIEMESN